MQARWLVLALVLAGCQTHWLDSEAPQAPQATVAAPTDGLMMGDEVRGRTENFFGTRLAAAESGDDANRPAAGEPREGERKMIHRGTIAVAVARTDDAIERLLTQVRGWGGHLAQRVDTRVTVRLPAVRFDEAVAALRAYGRVTHESIEAQDVTKQHLDLGIRLDNARRARDRLLALLEKATAVKDLLEIEGALRRLTEEIERLEGELKYLEDQVAMATLTAEFQTVTPTSSRGRAPASRFPWINRVGVEHVRRAF